jgi:hypothetical protein
LLSVWGNGAVVVKVNGIVYSRGWFFVGQSVYRLPQYVCVSSMVPVSVKVFFPNSGSVVCYFFVNVSVQLGQSIIKWVGCFDDVAFRY